MLHGLYRWMLARTIELQNERGATAVEYGLMVALIAAVIVAVVALLGQDIRGAFQAVVNAIPGGGGPAAP
jgi:pilus assembly protein Flp/PilA